MLRLVDFLGVFWFGQYCAAVFATTPPACTATEPGNTYYILNLMISTTVNEPCVLTMPVRIQSYAASGSSLTISAELETKAGSLGITAPLTFGTSGHITISVGVLTIADTTINSGASSTSFISSPSSGSVSLFRSTIQLASGSATQHPFVSINTGTFIASSLSVVGASAIGPTPLLQNFLSATSPASVSIISSTFESFDGGSVISVSGDSLSTSAVMQDVTFRNLGKFRPLSGHVVNLINVPTVSLTSISLANINASRGIVVTGSQIATVTTGNFSEVFSDKQCAVLFVNDLKQTATLSDLEFTKNVFGKGDWSACVFSSESVPGPTTVEAKRLKFSENTPLEELALYEMTGWSLLFQGNTHVTLQDLDFEGESKYFPSVGFATGVRADVLVNSAMPGHIKWRGFLSLCADVKFNGDAELNGRLVLSRPDEYACPQLNTVDMGGHVLHITNPFLPSEEFEIADHWLQTVHFKNGEIYINSPKTTVCCDIVPDDLVSSDSITLSGVQLYANTTLTWGAAKTGFNLSDSSSKLIIQSSGVLLQTRPQSHLDDQRPIISGPGSVIVEDGGQIFSAALDIQVAEFELSSAAFLHVYPSKWIQETSATNYEQHTNLSDTTGLIGSVGIFSDYVKGDFIPNLVFLLDTLEFASMSSSSTFSPAVYTPLKQSNGAGVAFTGTIIQNGNIQFAQLPTNPVSYAPIQMSSIVAQITADLTTIVVDFPIPIISSTENPCPPLEDPIVGIKCLWVNSTRVNIFAPRLPRPEDSLHFEGDMFGNATLQGPDTPLQVTPVISYTFDRCGGLIVSAEHSLIGSVIGVEFGWTFVCSSSAAPCREEALSATGSSYKLNILDPDFSSITNQLDVTLTIRQYDGTDYTTTLTIEIPSEPLALTVDGPTNRIAIYDAEYTLFARFNLPFDCPGVENTRFEWSNDGGIDLPPQSGSPYLQVPKVVPTSSSPALWIVTFFVNATFPDGRSEVASTQIAYARENPAVVSLTSRYTYSNFVSPGFSDIVSLRVDLQPPLATGMEPSRPTKFVWHVLDCPGLSPDSRFKRVVSLNLTVPDEFKCKLNNGSSFDGPFIDYSPLLDLPFTSNLLPGTYSFRASLMSESTGQIVSTISPATIKFEVVTGQPANWAEIVLPPLAALKAGQRLPIRVQLAHRDETKTQGLAILNTHSIQWSLYAPHLIPLPEDITKNPLLVVPFQYLLDGDITVKVNLISKTAPPSDTLTAVRVLSLGKGPSGGRVIIKQDAGEFLITTLGWKSYLETNTKAPPQLRYSYFLEREGASGARVTLADLTDAATIRTRLVGGDANYFFTVQAFDALGRVSAPVTVSFNTAGKREENAAEADFGGAYATSLQAARNASDWRLTQAIVSQNLLGSSSGSTTTQWLNRTTLLNSSLSFSSVLPDGEDSAASLLSQIETIINTPLPGSTGLSTIDLASQAAILEEIAKALGSNATRFGSASVASLTSSNAIMGILSSLLQGGAPGLLNVTDSSSGSRNLPLLLSLLSQHASQVLAELFPDEALELGAGFVVKLTTGKVGGPPGSRLQLLPRPGGSGRPPTAPPSGPSPSISFPSPNSPIFTPLGLPLNPVSSPTTSPASGQPSIGPASPLSSPLTSPNDGSDSGVVVIIPSAPVETYIGFSVTVFENGSYPVPSGIPLVTVVEFGNPGAGTGDMDPTQSYKGGSNTPGTTTPSASTLYVATFPLKSPTPSGKQAACATFDENKQEWVTASGCTTRRSGNEVSCTCGSNGPKTLSVVFQVGDGLNAAPGNKKGLSTIAIVMLAVFLSILFILIVLALIFALSKGARRTVRPFSVRAHGAS